MIAGPLIEDYAETLGQDGRDHASIEFGMDPAADASVCCYVRDHGAGLQPRLHPQAVPAIPAPAHHPRVPGTGMGLASVRQVVDQHHGRSWAEGAVGAGATFFFTLQAAEPAGPTG